MALAATATADELDRACGRGGNCADTTRSLNSAVSWGAIAAASTRMAQGNDGGPMGYFIDSLFRREAAAAAPTAGTAGSAVATDANERASGRDTAEVSRIFMNVSRSEPLAARKDELLAQAA